MPPAASSRSAVGRLGAPRLRGCLSPSGLRAMLVRDKCRRVLRSVTADGREQRRQRAARRTALEGPWRRPCAARHVDCRRVPTDDPPPKLCAALATVLPRRTCCQMPLSRACCTPAGRAPRRFLLRLSHILAGCLMILLPRTQTVISSCGRAYAIDCARRCSAERSPRPVQPR
jgi:hypothetical protein